MFIASLSFRFAAIAAAWLSVPEAPVYVGPVGEDTRAADGTSWFACTFTNAGEIVSARWTVAGLGVFETFVNGNRIGDEFLKPGFTHYAKTKYSFSYDVTHQLARRKGSVNTLSAEVSAGWWRDKIVTPSRGVAARGFVGKKSAFYGELDLVFADGRRSTLGTNTNDWRCGIAGAVNHAAIFDGEEYDARIKDPIRGEGLCSVPEVNAEFSGKILPTQGAEVTLRRDLAMARGPYSLKKGETLVVDFGQNCAAVPEFRFSAKRGTVLTALPAEMLNDADKGERGCDGPKGSVYRENLRCPDSGMRVVYTFAGEGVETYLPRFTFFGYRYISITATDDVEIESVASVPVTSIKKEMELGKIETGDKDLNRFIKNVYWGQLSNYLSVPTDCPQRNERLGWMEDTQVFCEAGSFNADTRSFFRKFTRDMRDSQDEEGGYPSVAPFSQYGNETFAFGWADAGVIVPWTVWRQFGDETIVRDNWDAMAKFVRKLDETKYDFEGKIDYMYADWLSYETFETCGNRFGSWEKWKNDPDAMNYRRYLAACYWLYDARLMTEMGRAVGKADDAAWFESSAQRALKYIRGRFLESDGLLLKPMRHLQTACVFALKHGIVKGAAREATKGLLLKSIREHGDCLQTGFLGIGFIMDALTECGASDVAYTLLLQHKNPSWLYSVDQGATTVWERWNSYTKADGFGPVSMNSFNHYAFGSVLAWIYRTAAGIAADSFAPGFKRIVMAPKPDRRLGYVKAEYKSAAGLVKSAWRYVGDEWIWEFSVPAGATARVTLPGETESKDYAPGSYVIRRPQIQKFVDSVAVDAALSWISSPGRFTCPVAYSNDTYRYVVDQAARIGVRHLRERLKWEDVSPKPSIWEPGRYLENAELLRQRGIAVSGMFHDAPAYALPDKKLPRDLAATFLFCKRLSETFGSRMEMWEFWNEEDIGFTNEGAWEYAAAFKAASIGFRAGGFKGIVAPGALCRSDRGAYEVTLYRNGCADYADVMNFHVYSPPSAYGKVLGELRRFMSGFGIGDRAVVVTECGTNQDGDCDKDGVMPGLKRHSPSQEAVQEEFVVKSQILMRMEGVAKNYFFAFGAYNERNGKKDWGIMRRDGTMKPAAAALGRLIAEVGNGVLAGEVETSDPKVRAFRFDMPDGKVKIAYWRRTEIDDGKDVVRMWPWSDMGTDAYIRLEDGGRFDVCAKRRAQYACLPSKAKVKIPPCDIGRIGAMPPPGEDRFVVFRADFDKRGYALGGNKSTLEMKGGSIGLTLEVWNLGDEEKNGSISFDGRGKVFGLPAGEVSIPPCGKASFPLRYEISGETDPVVSFSGEFNGQMTTPFVVPVFSEAKYLAECDVVECAASKKGRWSLNSSASSSDCSWDDAEKAVMFSFRWPHDKNGMWFFPRYRLDLPREAMDGAMLLAFRVKSRQDKVENDYKSARIYLKGRGGSRQYMCSAPTHDWETKYIEIPEDARKMGVTAIEFGGHPKGHSVDFWIKDVRIFRRKPAACAHDVVFSVLDFGAKGDGVTKDTAAIQRVIDAAYAAGGGEVLLPQGTYLSGSLFLKNGVDFHLADGAVLKASPDKEDYNAVDVCPQNSGGLGRGDNTSGGHLVLCVEAENVKLRGPGKIDGNAPAFMQMPDGSHPPSKMDIPWRPSQMVWFVESTNIVVRDIELADAPYWSCFVYGCENVLVENTKIHTIRNPHTYNGDGLDIDSSRHVRVTGCSISTADDALTLRASGAKLKKPGDCAFVTVENSFLSSDCNAVRMGVGNGTIRDCEFRNIRIGNTRYAVNAVGAWGGKPQRGVNIRNISFENLDVDALGFCKFYYWMATNSVFDGIRFKNVRGNVREESIFEDTQERPFLNLAFDNVRLEGETSTRIPKRQGEQK